MAVLTKIKSRINALRLRLFFLRSVQWRVNSSKRRILLVKNDSIGDYIIFRNFLEEIGKSDKFRNYELYLLTTRKLQPIAEDLDGTVFKDILVLPDDLISVNGQLSFYKRIGAYAFEYILHPTYSPDNKMQYLMKYLPGRYKIGFDGDLSNQTAADKANFERYYTRLIGLKNRYSHEFEKNRDFFTAVLEQDLALVKPVLRMQQDKAVENRILICPGAQHKFRIWNPGAFAALMDKLHAGFPHYVFTIVTGPGEDNLYQGIQEHLAAPVTQYKIDRIGNLAALIASSRLVICNDSSAAHIAVACDTQSVCISNGNHLGRFIPYPAAMKVRQEVVLPPVLLKELEAGTAEKYYQGSTLNINEITVDAVYAACVAYLTQTV